MSSTTTLRNDTARTGTNPNFPINTNPWRKYLSVDLGTTVIGGQTVTLAPCGRAFWWWRIGYSDRALTRARPIRWSWSPPPPTKSTATEKDPCWPMGMPLRRCGRRRWAYPDHARRQQHCTSSRRLRYTSGGCGEPAPVCDGHVGRRVGHRPLHDVQHRARHGRHHYEPGISGRGGSRTCDLRYGCARSEHCNQSGAGWLWLGFAAFAAYDAGHYYGWVMALNRMICRDNFTSR